MSLKNVLPNKNASEFQSCLDLRSYRSWILIFFTRNSNGEGDIKELIRYNFYRCKLALTNPEIYPKIHYHWERLKPNFNLMINFFFLKIGPIKDFASRRSCEFQNRFIKNRETFRIPFQKVSKLCSNVCLNLHWNKSAPISNAILLQLVLTISFVT